MRQYILLIMLSLSVYDAVCQYDFIIKSLNLNSNNNPTLIEGLFEKKLESSKQKKIYYYDFSNPNYDFCYYPMQQGISCGYFKVNSQIIEVKNAYPYNLGCDLDYGSFELSEVNFKNNKYLILTSINNGSGSSTRNVFCNLFDITNLAKIIFHPLWSLYGSKQCFGDFDQDNNLDFLEIRYDHETESNNDNYRITLTSLNKTEFKRKESKFIVFKREYKKEDLPKITVIEDNFN